MLNTGCVAGGLSTISPERIWSCDVDTALIKAAKARGIHADYADLNMGTPYKFDFFNIVL